MKKTKLVIIGCGIIISAIIYSTVTSLSTASNKKSNYERYYNEPETEETLQIHTDSSTLTQNSELELFKKGMPIDTDPESITVFVNKEYSLPEDYIPTDLIEPNVTFSFDYKNEKRLLRREAAIALEELFYAASLEGHELSGVSGYRSYKRQKEIYTKNMRTKGEAFTNLYSAKPGFSEHQTGLAIDISSISFGYRLSEEFGDTAAGKWVNSHAHEYGYIIRYPEGKENLTGYSYEPWHIRYVGIGLATYLYENHLTFEEYFDYTPPVFDKPSYESSDEMEHDTYSETPELSEGDSQKEHTIQETDKEQEDSKDDSKKPTNNNNDKTEPTKEPDKPKPDKPKPNKPKPENSKPESENNSDDENTKPPVPEEDTETEDSYLPDNEQPETEQPDNNQTDNEQSDNMQPDSEQSGDGQPGNNQVIPPSENESAKNNCTSSSNGNT